MDEKLSSEIEKIIWDTKFSTSGIREPKDIAKNILSLIKRREVEAKKSELEWILRLDLSPESNKVAKEFVNRYSAELAKMRKEV